MTCVDIDDGSVAGLDLPWVIEDDNLRPEFFGLLGWVVVEVGGDVSSLDITDRDVSDVEPDIVSGAGLLELLVVLLDGFDL